MLTIKLLPFLLFLVVTGCLGQGKAKRNPEPAAKKHTASPQVRILADSLWMPQLKRHRRIWVYLPPDYGQSDKKYPVLYMHDGQNLFDEYFSYSGEWGVDESLDSLHAQSGFGLIVVGIDNGSDKRMNEYSPWKNERFGDPEGAAYADFVAQTLKPLVDKTYRTLPDPAHTGIMGSSMGGLISHYALLRYPQTFSKGGILSPSYWFSPEVFSFTTAERLPENARLYFRLGGEEGKEMARDLHKMLAHLQTIGLPPSSVRSEVVPGGKHHESFWRREFPGAVLWLFQ
jgi:predicted alpha/beta superfamily hydrolase